MKNDRGLLNFCNNIEKIRLDFGKSDAEMQKIMHISAKTLNHIKKGMVTDYVSVEVLFHLQKHFNVNIASLFEEEYKIKK